MVECKRATKWSPTRAVLCALATVGLCLTLGVVPSIEAQVSGTTIGANPACLVPVDPVPSGTIDRPFAEVPTADSYLHSSTHLQGRRATVKWAGGLMHRPAVSTWFNEMTSALVINNPHPTQATAVLIDYFDHLGTLVGTTGPWTIPAEGFHTEAATPLAGSRGVGSARITVQGEGPEIVGAVLWHLARLFDGAGFEVLDPDPNFDDPGPGAASMQQLQVVQDATELVWGPLPVSSVSTIDFFNGAQPILNVVNPNNAPNRVRVELSIHTIGSGATAQLVWRVVDLPPFGSLTDVLGAHLTDLGTNDTKALWNQLFQRYLAFSTGNQASDSDYTLRVISEDDLPILGDVVVTDIWGPVSKSARNISVGGLGGIEPEPRPQDNLLLGGRFRMASSMLAPTPTWRLLNPDLTFDYTPTNGVPDLRQTMMLVSNVGAADAGPVHIQYYDRDGNQLAAASVPSLLPDQTLRIQPGAHNYPSTTHNPFGWARITACLPGAELVGWSLREVRPLDLLPAEYRKAFGELLVGNGGLEPGDSFASGDGDLRKVIPLARVWLNNPFPGDVTFGNFAGPQIGDYTWEFADGGGVDCSVGTVFNTVPFGSTSSTHVDPNEISGCGTPFAENLNGRVDHDSGTIEGIDIIGDPLSEYDIPDFAQGGMEQ